MKWWNAMRYERRQAKELNRPEKRNRAVAQAAQARYRASRPPRKW